MPGLAALLLIGLFLGLGIWQMHRADEKRQLVDDLERRAHEPAVALSPPIDRPQLWRNRRIRAAGHYDTARQFLLDNRVYRGQVGYHVLTPLQLDGTTASVLVDRGWVPAGADRSILPELKAPGTRIQVLGTAYVPYAEGFHIGEMDTDLTRWPRVIQFVDYQEIAHRLGTHLIPLTIRLDPNLPDGYVRDWDRAPFSPERHLGYAVQWFALSAALLVIFLALSIKRDDMTQTHD